MEILTQIAEGRPSLVFIIIATAALLAIVAGLTLYLMLLRSWYVLRQAHRTRRRALYQPAIELLLMDEPYEKILQALRPRLWGDDEIVQDVMTEAMQQLEGPPFETLQHAAIELGFLESNLRALSSWDRHRRGHAIERLGLLRCKTAVAPIVAILGREHMGLRLVCLRALAAIGDPVALPQLLETARTMPPGLLARMASLMLEFGAPGRDAVKDLLNTRAEDFPAASIPRLLQELAVDWRPAP